MNTKAAVARKASHPLTIEIVELGGPKEGEVLVELKATGMQTTEYGLGQRCHLIPMMLKTT